jgi:predicted RNA-binding protein with PUA-like domain
MPALAAHAGLYSISGCVFFSATVFLCLNFPVTPFLKRDSMRTWLMKSEPSDVSIDDLANKPKQTVPWYGVRNYQARNFMRDDMQVGDRVLFYHSSCPEPGIAGIAEVASTAYPDATQFDPKSKYYDPKATLEQPRWVHVDVKLVRKIGLIPLSTLRDTPALAEMRLLAKGSRLSITPVEPAEWKVIEKLIVKQ